MGQNETTRKWTGTAGFSLWFSIDQGKPFWVRIFDPSPYNSLTARICQIEPTKELTTPFFAEGSTATKRSSIECRKKRVSSLQVVDSWTFAGLRIMARRIEHASNCLKRDSREKGPKYRTEFALGFNPHEKKCKDLIRMMNTLRSIMAFSKPL